MWFGTEKVDGIHLRIGLSTVLDALDSCKVASLAEELRGEEMIFLADKD